MLNMFSKSSVPLIEEVEPPARNLSDARKKLRWLINNPPADLAKVMKVDADMAAAMLERNKDDEWRNRPHSEKGLRRYAKIMSAGRWKMTGEPIIFSKCGNCLNGQHRLMACIQSGVDFETLVVFGIDDDAFAFMDTGIARSAAHIFAIEGVANEKLAAASSRLLYGYKQRSTWDGGNIEVENATLYEFYTRHLRLQDSFPYARQLYKELSVTPRWGAFLHYICAEKGRNDANSFFEMLATGIGIQSKASAMHKLRQRLIKAHHSSSDTLNDNSVGAFVIKAWNATRQGKTLDVLKWRGAGAPNETFPRAE